MLQADYEQLPAFPIPAHVLDKTETIDLLGWIIELYRFDDGCIGLWWAPCGPLHRVMMPLIEGRAVWNRMSFHWYIEADLADEILRGIERLQAEHQR